MKKLTQEELETIQLPKWPCLLVTGLGVTMDQAMEIIIRTNSDDNLGCNDKSYQRLLMAFLGIEMDDDGWSPKDWNQAREVWDKLGRIELSYLGNSRIMSAYVHGPHGWINWDGTVGCSSYNIGKWPTTKDVLEDWTKIAKTWPFLQLKSQLLSEENVDADKAKPLIEFHIEGGKVEAYEPDRTLEEAYRVRGAQGENIMHILQPGGERGCSPMLFKKAIEVTRAAVQREQERAQTTGTESQSPERKDTDVEQESSPRG